VGDDLLPLQRPPVDRVQIARYAAVSGDLDRFHVDEPYAVAAGFRSVFAPGAMSMGVAAQLIGRWLVRGRLEKLSSRFVKLVRPGDALTAHARIAELRREEGACHAELELWAENQKGELVLRGHATCEIPEGPSAVRSAGSPSQAPRPTARPR
jgi:acyl dehydratase